MSRPLILLTRPEDEADRGRSLFDAAGFDVLQAPLLRLRELDFHLPLSPVESLLFTSPRAPALAAARFPVLRDVPVGVVGPRTAQAAKAAGFNICWEGETDGSAIVAMMASAGIREVLQLGTLNPIYIKVPAGLRLKRIAVYDTDAVDGFPEAVIEALAQQRIFAVGLFSPRSATLFLDQLKRYGVSPDGQRLLALSPNVAKAAGGGWKAVQVAHLPNLAEVVAAASRMWHEHDYV